MQYAAPSATRATPAALTPSVCSAVSTECHNTRTIGRERERESEGVQTSTPVGTHIYIHTNAQKNKIPTDSKSNKFTTKHVIFSNDFRQAKKITHRTHTHTHTSPLRAGLLSGGTKEGAGGRESSILYNLHLYYSILDPVFLSPNGKTHSRHNESFKTTSRRTCVDKHHLIQHSCCCFYSIMHVTYLLLGLL
jgi:hypothetical protein